VAAPLGAIVRHSLLASWTLGHAQKSFTMPPKRKDNETAPTGRELKKQKIEISRTIHVQSKAPEVDPAPRSSKSVKFDSKDSDPSYRKNEKLTTFS
jgi:hypothetical protein